MPNLLSIIAESWDFCRKQQAIIQVAFWYMFIPALIDGLMTDGEIRAEKLIQSEPEIKILLILGYLILSLIIAWGCICVLIIGKRLLQAKSGRTRSSTKTVRSQASQIFIPYILTSILRTIVTLLWTILLVIPGIIYAVRTVFYPIIIATEGISYRPALRRSMEIVKGQFWNVFLTVVGLACLTLFPSQILSGIFSYMAKDAPPAILLAADIASAIVMTIALVVYQLSLIQAYGYFRPNGEIRN